MLLSSLLSLLSSFVLSIEAIKLAENADAKLSCNINTLISCGKVAKSWQSNLLGFPNPFLGLVCEPVVITVAIAGLMGVTFPKTFMKVAHFFYGAGLIFALWLFSQSFFVIKAFCPWCLLVTLSTITVFSSITKVNLINNIYNFSTDKFDRVERFYKRGLDTAVLSIVYGLLVVVIIAKYHNYLF